MDIHHQLREADNCVRENKNGPMLKFLSYLVATQKMDLTSISFGRVGHTHGPLGVLASILIATSVITHHDIDD